MRRSTRVPHMPQNLRPPSFIWPQEGHFMVRPLVRTRLSAWRRSSLTPHMPQNLYSDRFSVPQKAHCIQTWLLELIPSETLISQTAAHLHNSRMMSGHNKLQALYHLKPSLPPEVAPPC